VKFGNALKYARYAKPDNAKKFAQHMVPHVVRPAQIIWNKAIGSLFGLLAAMFFWHAYNRADNPATLFMASFLGLVMLFFCIISFLRVRRLSRL
jgi:hypothetical protein